MALASTPLTRARFRAQLGRCLVAGEEPRQRSRLGLTSYGLGCDRVPW